MKLRPPSSQTTQRRPSSRSCFASLLRILPLALLAAYAVPTVAQLSLTSAVDLAERNNPRVLGAQDNVKRAAAEIDEIHDAYIPSINAGAGIGQAYGYLPNPPTLFSVTAGSLAFNISQLYYTKSARAGFNAASLALKDTREAVAQDTTLAYLTLDHDQQRQQVIVQQQEYAKSLVDIVQQRLDAGQDTEIDLKQAQIMAAQLKVASLTAGDTVDADRDHLARLIGLPSATLMQLALPADLTIPTEPIENRAFANAAVASAFRDAEAKVQQARGDGKFLFWPQINFFAQYNRYATFTDSFKTLKDLQNANSPKGIGADESAFGVQITLPFLDKVRSAKSREVYAEAQHTLHEAQNSQIEALDGESKLRHSIDELDAQSDLATLNQQYAELQLQVLQQQLQAGTGSAYAQQMTPKDEKKARIAERDKYLAVIDANFQVSQSKVQLLRQTGHLQRWLRSLVVAPAPSNLPVTAPAPKH